MGGGPVPHFRTHSTSASMALNASPLPTGIVPSKLQIALAIAILKTKPDRITVRGKCLTAGLTPRLLTATEYILHLRSHSKRGRQLFTEEQQHRHLDSVAYWRERYERAESKCHELEHRNVQLERANDALQIQYTPVNPSVSPKRKGDARKQAASSKRTRGTPEIPDNSVMAAHGTFGGDLDTLDGLGEGKYPFQFHRWR
jgi:hypothetical protein